MTNLINLDGGALPGPCKPQPDYRGPRRRDDPNWQERYKRAEIDPALDVRLALQMLMQAFGIGDSSLTVRVADLIDEHREYQIRLGIRDPRPMMGNPG